MRYLGLLFFLFCFTDAIAQPIDSLKYRDLAGYTQKSCYMYIIKNYATTDTILAPIKKYGTIGSDSTIYIVATSYGKDWPIEVDGYHLVYVDLEKDREKLFCEQQAKKIPILYLSQFVNKDDRYFCTVLPVVFKGKKEITYGHDACKLWFTFDYTKAQFYYTNFECTTF